MTRHYCNTCGRCQNNSCSFFQRHVEPDYNRCSMHTDFNKSYAVYKSPSKEELEAIIKANEDNKEFTGVQNKSAKG